MSSSSPVSGFTLVELLVVLAIAAAAGALTGPDLFSAYQRSSEQLTVIEYGRELTAMRRTLMFDRKALVIEKDALSLPANAGSIPLPGTGWTTTGNSELMFLPTGVTNGGYIDLESPTGRSWRLNMAVLDGRVDVERR